MKYRALHYTETGDEVFHGFCGTGMAGVAAQMCSDKAMVEPPGCRVDNDGTMHQRDSDESRKIFRNPFSEARCILREAEDECGWLHETPLFTNAAFCDVGISNKKIFRAGIPVKAAHRMCEVKFGT